MENENNFLLVDVNCSLLGVEYSGKVRVNLENGDVDLLGLCNDDGLIIRRDGRNLVSVVNALKGLALREADLQLTNNPLGEFYHKDVIYSYYAPASCFNPYIRTCYVDNTKYILKTISQEFRGDFFFIGDFSTYWYKDENGEKTELFAPSYFWESCQYCERCSCYVHNDYYNSRRCMCNDCVKYCVIEGYGESHEHNSNPVFWAWGKNCNSIYNPDIPISDFSGFGFELEIDCEHSRQDNNDNARFLSSYSGLKENQLRFARDGSLENGFEIISEPHTIRAFWECSKQWTKMLTYLSNKGYVSHNMGTCGLHIHVSRVFFGKEKAEQDRAIAKIFSFYSDNWNDLVKASRRTIDGLGYCNKNPCNVAVCSYRYPKYLKWKVNSKHNGGHYVALNNANRNTFEFRLGRGTLNPLSFFSWIDLTLTIAKNAKRITINQIETNDVASWLCGIKETTARYLLKRGAFVSIVKELFPCLSWDNNIDND